MITGYGILGEFVCIERFEAERVWLGGADFAFGAGVTAEVEETAGGLLVSQAATTKSRGTVKSTGRLCRTLRVGDSIVIPPPDSASPIVKLDNLEIWKESDLLGAVREVPVPEAILSQL